MLFDPFDEHTKNAIMGDAVNVINSEPRVDLVSIDVFQEDQAQDDMLVFRRVHVVAQLVGGEPEFGFEADVGGGILGTV